MSVATTNGKNIFNQYRILSRQVTANALGSGHNFPFVTIPRFESQAQLIGASTGATLITFMPVVAEDRYEEWVNYSLANKGQIDEGLRLAGSNETSKVIPYIWGTSDPSTPLNRSVNGYYCVGWQTYPAVYSNYLTNFDAMRSPLFEVAFDRMTNVREAVLSEVSKLYAGQIIDERNRKPDSSSIRPLLELITLLISFSFNANVITGVQPGVWY